jgi:putative addiction module component (TIGR02574 family)
LNAILHRTWNMPKRVAIPPPGFDELTAEEQIDYVQSLWERIAATPDQVPIPDWHRQVLDERLKDHKEANPDAGESWDIVRDRLRAKLRPR